VVKVVVVVAMVVVEVVFVVVVEVEVVEEVEVQLKYRGWAWDARLQHQLPLLLDHLHPHLHRQCCQEGLHFLLAGAGTLH
jgi:hypothetical protein